MIYFDCARSLLWKVLIFACGTIQNLCYERDWAELVVKLNVHRCGAHPMDVPIFVRREGRAYLELESARLGLVE